MCEKSVKCLSVGLGYLRTSSDQSTNLPTRVLLIYFNVISCWGISLYILFSGH